jgi:hypothetical protein
MTHMQSQSGFADAYFPQVNHFALIKNNKI